MAEFEHEVIVAGAGPTGLMLAGELTLVGVKVAIVEKRSNRDLSGSRGGGLHARTIEVLDQRGIAARFLAEGKAMQVNGFGGTPLDISDFPSRHPYGLALWQSHSEHILAGWIEELGVPVLRGREVKDFVQDEAGVAVTLADGERLRAQYLVGCDGGRSLVRKLAGIDFPGWDPTTSWIIAEAQMSEEPAWGLRENAAGSHAIGKVEEGGAVRLVLTDPEPKREGNPTLAEVRAALVASYGTDFGIHSPIWISRFTDMTRQAATYRARRVLLAGDAAHIHPPVGGQGLNIGVQDAVNLGWKLAQVVKGVSPESLLDTYHAERHPVAARVLKMTMAQTILRRVDERTKALTGILSELVVMDGPRKHLGAELSGLGVHYDLGEGHPLLGRRMPDLDLVTAADTMRVFSLLHKARPALLNLGQPGALDIAPWADRVQLVEAQYAGPWELPVLGTVPAPAAILIRPDGHVAWVGDETGQGLADALATWFGPPAAV